MKTRGLILIVLALAITLAAQFGNTSTAAPGYSAQLISPTAGQVLHPGQVFKVKWKSTLPQVGDMRGCESEVWLSLDGGQTFNTNVSPWIDPRTQSVSWTVPNLPTNQAVMDIRFGCEYPNPYPETFAPQPQSMFVIAKSAETSAAQVYSAHQVSPAAGQVLHPGQVVRVEWTSVLPKVRNLVESCEIEVRLSLDGGNSFPWRISPYLTANATSFNWTVPDTPTNAAVLDIRFGCDPVYPESSALQPGSMFVIAKPADW